MIFPVCTQHLERADDTTTIHSRAYRAPSVCLALLQALRHSRGQNRQNPQGTKQTKSWSSQGCRGTADRITTENTAGNIKVAWGQERQAHFEVFGGLSLPHCPIPEVSLGGHPHNCPCCAEGEVRGERMVMGLAQGQVRHGCQNWA